MESVFEGELVQRHRGQRLDQFLAAQLNESRSRVQMMIEQGLVLRTPDRGRPDCSDKVRVGETYTVQPTALTLPTRLVGEPMPLNILHEDDSILVLNKPPGLVVHPGAGHWTGTLAHGLVAHLGEDFEVGHGPERPGIVHRLDKDTSGLLVIAREASAHASLVEQFKSRQVEKTYQAIAWGLFARSQGECRGNIGRHPRLRQKMAVLQRSGKIAHTTYRVLWQGKQTAWVECDLHTGRTHQIRVHLAHEGHPLVGDTLYGRARIMPGLELPTRQMLHAARLAFEHPKTRKRVEFRAPLPDDFQTFLDQLHARDSR